MCTHLEYNSYQIYKIMTNDCVISINFGLIFRHSIFAFMSSQSDDSYANSTHLERTESSERQEVMG